MQIDTSIDGHVHTRLCHHASGEMEEYVQTAIDRGLKKLVFLEHLEIGINYFESTWLTDDDFKIYFAEGKRLQEEMKRYTEAVRGRQVEHYATKVEADGSFRFDDVPAGDYQLSARLQAPPADGQIVPGPVIANLTPPFAVAQMPGARSDEPLDLGSLTLDTVRRP